MPLSLESVKARLTNKFTQDVHNALNPLIQKSYAIKITVSVDQKLNQKLQKAAETQLKKFGDVPDLPGLVMEVHTENLNDLIGLNAKDEDLLPFVTRVDVSVIVDKSVKGPPAKVIHDVVRASINPLKHKRKDNIRITYEDLSRLYAKGMLPPPSSSLDKAEEVPPAVTKQELPKEPALKPLATTAVEISPFPRALEVTLGSPLLTGILVLAGLSALGMTMLRKTKSFRDKAEQSLDAFGKIPTAISESARAISNSLAALKPNPPQSSVKVELVGSGGKPVNTKTVQKMVQGPAKKDTPDPEKAYYSEKQVLSKVAKMLEKPETFSSIIGEMLSEGKKTSELARFLKILNPEQIKLISRYLKSSQLESMLHLASGKHRNKVDLDKLGDFVDKLINDFTAKVIEDVVESKNSDILLDLGSDEVIKLVREATPDLRACMLFLLPEEKRSEYFQRLNLSKRENDEIMARLVREPAKILETTLLDLFLTVAGAHYRSGRIDALMRLHDLAKHKLNSENLRRFSTSLEKMVGADLAASVTAAG